MAESITAGSGSTPQDHAFSYLTQPEMLFLDAAVARLIPSDELGPVAKEADVTYFIDQQLVSSWGTHGRNYRMGPWMEATPQQRFQSPLTPQEICRAAIRVTNIYCTKQYSKAFHLLTDAQRDEILHALKEDKVELESLSSKLFFGFPGVAASNYVEQMETHNLPYRAEPVSILDIREVRVQVDAQGYRKHVPLDGKK